MNTEEDVGQRISHTLMTEMGMLANILKTGLIYYTLKLRLT